MPKYFVYVMAAYGSGFVIFAAYVLFLFRRSRGQRRALAALGRQEVSGDKRA